MVGSSTGMPKSSRKRTGVVNCAEIFNEGIGLNRILITNFDNNHDHSEGF